MRLLLVLSVVLVFVCGSTLAFVRAFFFFGPGDATGDKGLSNAGLLSPVAIVPVGTSGTLSPDSQTSFVQRRMAVKLLYVDPRTIHFSFERWKASGIRTYIHKNAQFSLVASLHNEDVGETVHLRIKRHFSARELRK